MRTTSSFVVHRGENVRVLRPLFAQHIGQIRFAVEAPSDAEHQTAVSSGLPDRRRRGVRPRVHDHVAVRVGHAQVSAVRRELRVGTTRAAGRPQLADRYRRVRRLVYVPNV